MKRTTLFEPRYISLYKSGELEYRVKILEARLAYCDICPRKCQVDRLNGETSFCSSAYLPLVDTVCSHHGEEPVLSGTHGSGTIFFRNCNMKCVYCQNFQISQERRESRSGEMDFKKLASEMLRLQNLGCHNINFVSPTHFVPQIVKAVFEAVPMGLKVPLVYNTGGYDSLETLKELEGIVDIYMPDLRYSSNKWAVKFSRAPEYVSYMRAAIKEMHRQVGNLVTDGDGIAVKGMIVRHLILPNDISGSKESLTWLSKEVSTEITVSIMSQYYPAYRAPRIPLLSRRISAAEYKEVVRAVEKLGMENGWLQGLGAAEYYLPDFNKKDHPFEPMTEV